MPLDWGGSNTADGRAEFNNDYMNSLEIRKSVV